MTKAAPNPQQDDLARRSSPQWVQPSKSWFAPTIRSPPGRPTIPFSNCMNAHPYLLGFLAFGAACSSLWAWKIAHRRPAGP